MRTILTNLSLPLPFDSATDQYTANYGTAPQERFYPFWNPNGGLDPLSQYVCTAGQKPFLHRVKFSVVGMEFVRDLVNIANPENIGNGTYYFVLTDASGNAVSQPLGINISKWDEWLDINSIIELTDLTKDFEFRVSKDPGGFYTVYGFDILNIQSVYHGTGIQLRCEIDVSIPGIFKA